MNILKSVKELERELTAKSKDKDRLSDAKEEGLTEEGFFPQFAKFVVFGALAGLNVRLFVTTIPGVWGYVVAGAAVMSACFAVYCWNRVDRSKGKHLRVMQLGAAGFTALELLHATASVWELTVGLDGDAKQWAFWYSHKVAFPLMALSILVGYAAHRYTFWKAEINQARAASQITIAVERAQLDTQKARLENEAELAEANLAHLRRMQQIESETAALVSTLLPTSEQKHLSSVNTVKPVEKSSGEHVNGRTVWPEQSRPKA
jgi:hypothetical protein